MWRLDYPWLLLALPLAWAAYRWLPPYIQPREALRVPFFDDVARVSGQKPSAPGVRRGRVQLVANIVVWVLLLVALARPVFVELPLVRSEATRDILLAVDISQSMEARDFAGPDGQMADRLQAVLAVVSDFIDRRKEDRIGLIAFGSSAYPQAPLTQDHRSVHLLLDQLAVGMAGPNTAIGDAIGLAIRQFEHAPEQEKVLILLTDGNDTSSVVPPAQAAGMAAGRHITVHTIGIGDPTAQGEDRVDFDALRAIAQTTGGRFFEARDRHALEQVYRELDKITPHDARRYTHRPKQDYFWIPLSGALLLLVLLHAPAAMRSWRTGARFTQAKFLDRKAAPWKST